MRAKVLTFSLVAEVNRERTGGTWQRAVHRHTLRAYKEMAVPWEDLVAGVKKGNVRALAKMITRIENRDSGWKDAMKVIYPDTGATLVFGITGAPGAGKSTLTNKIAHGLVTRGYQVGIIAVDPSSPFSGGALLGDRLRMQDIATIEGIFIRSMATRGTLGGLCQGARDVIRIMDAFGKDIVLIETVGVGQDEIEVVRAADVVLVVSVPGLGDGIQTLKAGIMEIADLFVVNKADRDGADEVVSDIQAMLELSQEGEEAAPPVLKTSAVTGEGIESLVSMLVQLKEDKERPSRDDATRIMEEVLTLMEQELFHHIRSQWAGNGALQAAVNRIIDGERDPYSVAEDMLGTLKHEG
jgi:LAO/AO transport system kinase